MPHNDLELAKSVGVKLSELLDGMFTTGTGVMLLQPAFSGAEYTKGITALIQVLRQIWSWPASETEKMVARQAEQLDVLFSRFHTIFVALTDWRNMKLADIQTTVNDLAEAYRALMESLEMFLRFLGVTVDFSHQRAVCDALPTGFLDNVCTFRDENRCAGPPNPDNRSEGGRNR